MTSAPQSDKDNKEVFATVAVGGQSTPSQQGEERETHFYAHISPPKSILPDAVSKVVEEVGVQVACGNYDPATQKFSDDTNRNTAALPPTAEGDHRA